MPTARFAGQKLPYYYVEGDKLVKVGKSNQLGKKVFELRVKKRNYELIVAKLAEMAKASPTFATQDLVRACEIPDFEPRLVMNVLIERALIIKKTRGFNAFVNPKEFETDVARIWSALPRQ